MINKGDIVRYNGISRDGLYVGSRCEVQDIAGSSAAILCETKTYCVSLADLCKEGQMDFNNFTELAQLIHNRQKIMAIKLIRSIYGTGLKDSKDLIDMLTNN